VAAAKADADKQMLNDPEVPAGGTFSRQYADGGRVNSRCPCTSSIDFDRVFVIDLLSGVNDTVQYSDVVGSGRILLVAGKLRFTCERDFQPSAFRMHGSWESPKKTRSSSDC
jgi:hypothetical protein